MRETSRFDWLTDWFYSSDNLLEGKVEAYALFWFVIGTKHRGLFIPSYYWDSPLTDTMRSSKILPLLRIGAMTSTAEYSRRWAFQIMIFGFFIGLLLRDGKLSKLVFQRGFYNV
jgi:hypothetical protein